MSEIDERDKKAVPFFARFLEGQNIVEMSEEESEAIGGGMVEEDPENMTLKFPSDNEDGGDIVVTQKFPSDNEDDGGDMGMTEKFPSDDEDDGGPGLGGRRRRIWRRRLRRWRRRLRGRNEE